MSVGTVPEVSLMPIMGTNKETRQRGSHNLYLPRFSNTHHLSYSTLQTTKITRTSYDRSPKSCVLVRVTKKKLTSKSGGDVNLGHILLAGKQDAKKIVWYCDSRCGTFDSTGSTTSRRGGTRTTGRVGASCLFTACQDVAPLLLSNSGLLTRQYQKCPSSIITITIM